ncbi:hypothetical protein P6U16_11850 [Rhizobium sp. 32-5/1]|uniref:hypothetical protein n=1 Tax=Rhizobium sp. 32-5/1 TaxID=3019602 RepID=UPI00240E62E7|nr:hypothetical protein [Rhizobium sp. 32-5/1]WEZ81956.1 hypothetical protein P6U16_11850 [Rhizobium sp. 32-5/1]
MKAILAGFLAVFICAEASAAEFFDHNGSLMLVDYDTGTISYHEVKPSIRKIVSPGAIVFSGTVVRGKFAQGTAYTFRKGCPSAPYDVSGRYDPQLPGYILSGAAPHRPKSGCGIISYEIDNPNARLVFVDRSKDARRSTPSAAADDDKGFDEKTSSSGIAPKPHLPTATP